MQTQEKQSMLKSLILFLSKIRSETEAKNNWPQKGNHPLKGKEKREARWVQIITSSWSSADALAMYFKLLFDKANNTNNPSLIVVFSRTLWHLYISHDMY